MTTLYNLTQDYRALLVLDEYTEADMEQLTQLHGLIEDKAIQCAYVIKELEAKLDMTEEAIMIAKEKKERIAHNIERLKKYVLDNMQHNNIQKIDKDPLFDIKVRHNAPSVEDYEPVEIPVKYWVHKDVVSLDKKLVKEDIEAGIEVPGARLVRKISLSIK